MPQIRDQHSRGKIEKSPPFRSPVENAGAVGQNRLGRRISAKGTRLMGSNKTPGMVGVCFAGMMQRVFHELNTSLVENNWFHLAGEAQDQATGWAVDFRDAARLTACVPFQDRFHCLNYRHGVPVV